MLTSAYNAVIDLGGKTATGTIVQATPAAGTKREHRRFQCGWSERGHDCVSMCPYHIRRPGVAGNHPLLQPSDRTAKAGTDYVGQTNGHVTIAPGKRVPTFRSRSSPMPPRLGNVTFTIIMSYRVNNAIVSSTATVTIDYAPPTPAKVIAADSLVSWSNPTSGPTNAALDQVFAEM